MLNVLIVDDEPLARARLERLLQAHQDVTLVAEASHGEAALALCQQQKIDLVLLDIQMPGLDGLQTAECLQQLPTPPWVIFCTAYDEHALAAFRVQALDYLLKPVRPEDLAQALARATQRLTPARAEAATVYLVASGHRGVERIRLTDVCACVAEQKYVEVWHPQGQMLVETPLKELEELYPDYFVRCHRSALVARDKIQRLQSLATGGQQLWLAGLAKPVSVSRRHLASIKALLS